jgi:hypothetical protein
VRRCIHTFISNTINILLINEYRYRIRSGEAVLVPNTSSIQTILVDEALLAQGRFLLEEQALNKAISGYDAVLEGQHFQNRRTEFGTKVNLNKE